jgi:predicted ester cyclase
MTQQAHGQRLAETFLSMINTHDPSLLDRFVAEDYRDHSAFVSDGREANRQFWTAFFAAIPDVSGSMADLVISGDRVVGRFVHRGTHTGGFMGIPADLHPENGRRTRALRDRSLAPSHPQLARIGIASVLVRSSAMSGSSPKASSSNASSPPSNHQEPT